MPGCVLHVIGENLDPNVVLVGSSLEPYSIYRKGDRRRPESKINQDIYLTSGFKCDVSVSGDQPEDLQQQIQDAISFMTTHSASLKTIPMNPTVEEAYFDFGYECRKSDSVMVHVDILPVEFIRLCGEFGIAVMLSLYPVFMPSEPGSEPQRGDGTPGQMSYP